MLIGKYVNMRIFWHQCFFFIFGNNVKFIFSPLWLKGTLALCFLWKFRKRSFFCKIWLLRIFPDSWNLLGQRQSPGILVLNQDKDEDKDKDKDKDKVLGSCCWINPFKRYLIIFGNWFSRYFLREKSKNYTNVATL